MGRHLDETYWNKRYQQEDTGWDAGGITTPLKAYFDQLENKQCSVLIPGAGNAYEAEYLINNGFREVYICDLAETPLQNFLKRNPAFNPQHLLQKDFFELTGHTFDLIVEQTFFCALQPELRQQYFTKMTGLLKPGGRLVGVLFDAVLTADPPPFGGSKEEYLGYIKPPLKIHTFEACYNSIKPRQGRELFINLVKEK